MYDKICDYGGDIMIKLFEKFFDIEFSKAKLEKINTQIRALEKQYYKERIACLNRPLSLKGEFHFERMEHRISRLEKKASHERQKQFKIKKRHTR